MVARRPDNRSSSKQRQNPAGEPAGDARHRDLRGWRWVAIPLGVVVVVGAAVGLDRGVRWPKLGGQPPVSVPGARASFVGSERCAACHSQEYLRWQGSQHDQAMQVATEQTVLGDFGEARFTSAAGTSAFFRRGDRFMVRTDGSDGLAADFEVKYTFGVYPLQQYLVQFPDGRLQPLQIAWDSRPREEGGQVWFHLYADDIPEHSDPLHWTAASQNWNFMCADCHSTNVRRGYDAATDRFATTWSDIDVGCEACHGPGSAHVEWARSPAESVGDATRGLTVVLPRAAAEGKWIRAPGASTALRSTPLESRDELAVCAQCHSHRAQIAEGYFAGARLHDYYLPSLLSPGLYHPDGQQLDEVYTYGSFVQSRMYAAGVTCTDCHDPHTQELRAPGNQLCTQCHSPTTFDASAHHRHQESSEGSSCVACHMPSTTYMRVDARRDHSFRIPRPDQSLSLGVPNACAACHTNQTDEWAALTVRRWSSEPPRGFQRFGETFAAADRGEPGASAALVRIATESAQPDWIRASALARLATRPGAGTVEAARAAVKSPDPMLRFAALQVAEALPPADRAEIAAELLTDSTRIVRMQAIWVLAPVAATSTPARQPAFSRAIDEFIDVHRGMADRPEMRLRLGSFFVMLGRYPEAESELTAAIRLSPYQPAGYVNLADLLRLQGREAPARETLEHGLARMPDDPTLHHSLGLALVRSGDLSAALGELGEARELAPEEPRYAYTYATALRTAGQNQRAIEILVGALRDHPADRDLLVALATFHRDDGQRALAMRYAERLATLWPDDAGAQALLRSLRSGGE